MKTKFEYTYRLEPGHTGAVHQTHTKKAKKQLRRMRIVSLAFSRSGFRHLSPNLMSTIPILGINGANAYPSRTVRV